MYITLTSRLSTVCNIVSLFRRRMAEYGSCVEDARVMNIDSWGGQSIIVWGSIGMNHKAGPVIFLNIGTSRGNGVTALRYINEVLRLHIEPYCGHHQHHMFQQDNVRAGTFSNSTTSESCHDLPSEHVWDEIQRQLNEV